MYLVANFIFFTVIILPSNAGGKLLRLGCWLLFAGWSLFIFTLYFISYLLSTHIYMPLRAYDLYIDICGMRSRENQFLSQVVTSIFHRDITF